MKLFFFFALLSTSLFAALPAPPLKGIILISSEEELNLKGYLDFLGVAICNVDIPNNAEELRELLAEDLCNCYLTEERIDCIKQTIIQYYRKHHRPVVSVISPAQDSSTGVLQLIIVEARLGNVEVQGNCYFASERLRGYLRLEPGEVIHSDTVNKDLAWINRNPFRQADLIYRPGNTFGTTDISLVVQDRRTYRFYSGIDNTGNDVTGNNRIFAGFNWGNSFGWDHILSYQFTSSPDFKKFTGNTINYKMPLPWRHVMTIYGGYSTVDAKYNVPAVLGIKFRNHGHSGQASLRYDIMLKPIYNFLHEFSWGFDYKQTNNSLEFGGVPIITDQNVNLTQFMASYNLGYQTEKLTTTFEVEVYGSPFRWLPDQTNADFQTLRTFAKSKYVYGRSSFTFIHHFHSAFYYSIYLRGQAASTNLLPSEEYGIGGYDTVRGYKERQANGDSAINFNLELLTTPFIFSRIFYTKKGRDEMQVLLFFDYGAAFVHKKFMNIDTSHALYSVGPGLRYRVLSYLLARLDYGFQLHTIFSPVIADHPHHRLHFQLIGSY